MARTSGGRRQLVVVAATTILLALAPALWRLRPLSPLEKRLVGEWQTFYGIACSPSPAFTLRSDRSFRMRERTGHWHASNGQLFFSYSFSSSLRTLPGSFRQRVASAWDRAWPGHSEEIQFDRAGRVQLASGTLTIWPEEK